MRDAIRALPDRHSGGNTVLTGGLGPTAKARFARDVLGQRGVKWVIILEGVNDIGYAGSAAVATDLIAAFDGLITAAHAANLLVLGVPILPFGGSSYDSTLHETARQTVNTWIRTSGVPPNFTFGGTLASLSEVQPSRQSRLKPRRR